MSFGTTPVSTTSLSTNQFPVSAVYIPNSSGSNLTALQGGPASSADSNGNVSAPAAIYIADGSDVTQGTSTDAANANTVIGQLKQIRLNTASVTIGGGTVAATQSGSWAVTANIGTSGSLALDTSVNGILVSQGSATSGEKGPLIQAAVTTSAPSYTTAQTSPLSLTLAGALRVDASAVTQPVSGTVTANQGGTWTIQPGNTANTTPWLATINQGGNSATVASLTNSKALAVEVVDGSGTQITSFGGSNASVSATASGVPSSATYIGGNKAGNLVGVSLDSSGNLNVNVAAGGASGGTSSSFGAAFPSTGTAIGASDGTNMQGLLVESSSNKNLRVGIYSGANEATVTGSNALKVDNSAVTQPVSGTITANIGTTNGLALDTSVNGILLAQGSTTSGQSGPIVQGAVTTNAPTYTTAKTNPLSLDTSGLLRVSLKDTPANTNNLNVALAASSATVTVTGTVSITANSSVNVAQVGGSNVSTAASGVQKVGIVGNAGATVDSTVGAGTAPTNQVVVGSVYSASAPAPTNGQAMAIQADQAGNLRTFPGIALATLSAWNSSTSLNATQTIFSNSGVASVLVQLTQTTTLTGGAATFEVSYDGSNWSTIPANDVLDPTSTTFAQISVPYTVQANTNKAFLLNTSGAQALRIKLSTQITGSGTVTPNYALLATSPVPSVIALSPTAANFQTTATQSGTWNINNISGTVSLPTGAATAAKQPALGTAGSASSDVITVQGIASMTALKVDGSGVTQPVSGTVSITANSAVNIAQVAGGNTSNAGQTGAMQVGGAVATNTAVSSATNPLLIAGSDYGGTPKVQSWKVDSSGNGQVAVTNTPSVAQSGTWTVQPGNTPNTSAWLVQTVTGTSGGSTPYHNVVSSGTNATNVKASAGQVYEGIITNTSSSPVYFRFYDTSTAPTVGTTAVKRTIPVLGNGITPFSWPNGMKFTSGISWGISALIADADTTAISSSVSIDFGYD